MKKILPYLILLSALSVSGSAAFYSVYGLSKLFAGASLQVIIMASSLEISKLVIATLLHHYWAELNRMLKIYLTTATIILVMITSAGIYGFLSSAYQETANADKIITRQIELIDTKKQVYIDQKNELQLEKNQLIESISELRNGLSNPGQVQYIDSESGKMITTTSAAARKSLEKQLSDAIENRNNISTQIQISTDSINTYEIQKVELLNSSDVAAELGPLKYISSISGYDMDKVVNYFLLLIIFVFDPLAIALVLAANFAFNLKKDSIMISENDTEEKELYNEIFTSNSTSELDNKIEEEKNEETDNSSVMKMLDEIDTISKEKTIARQNSKKK